MFAGGFEQDATTEVCSSPQLPAGQIVEVLGALVDKSVLKRQLRDSSPPRYWLLETLRQYGRQRLRELGGETVTQKRHLDWIRALAKTAGAWDGRQPEMFARMSSERDNLRAALDFCLRQPGEVAAAAELAQHLMHFWACHGPFGDARRVPRSCCTTAMPVPAARGMTAMGHATTLTALACADLARPLLDGYFDPEPWWTGEGR